MEVNPYIIDFLNDKNTYEYIFSYQELKESTIQFLINGKQFKQVKVEDEYKELISISKDSYKEICDGIK